MGGFSAVINGICLSPLVRVTRRDLTPGEALLGLRACIWAHHRHTHTDNAHNKWHQYQRKPVSSPIVAADDSHYWAAARSTCITLSARMMMMMLMMMMMMICVCSHRTVLQVCACVCMRVCACVHVRVHVYVRIHVCVCVCVCTCVERGVRTPTLALDFDGYPICLETTRC